MTDAERLLWRRLRAHRLNGLNFRRQVPIGPFIVDFACHAHRLIVELDGGQHGDAAAASQDAKRTEWLSSKGHSLLRFWNSDVLRQLDAVLQSILDATVHPTPPSRHSLEDANGDLPLRGGGEDNRGDKP
jgi:very-short-patch-repair endonuclease